MQKKGELSIVADQYGAPTSAAVLADAVADIVRTNLTTLADAFIAANGKIHIAASGTTTWYGFAEAIFDGLKRRQIPIVTRRLIPIASKDYPTKADRPLNSRLDISRLAEVFRIHQKAWDVPLAAELDIYVNGLKSVPNLPPIAR
jgi:dTDP-4-dehydrorhamnose reductase